MQRFYQILFSITLLVLSWFAMMAFHEAGHVLGAWLTGGTVRRVVLHPLAISRTDVVPNPEPGVVVWLGPIVGCLAPLGIAASVPRRFRVTDHVARFVAGFCFIANGSYIALGSWDRVGDCGEMISTGTPIWILWAFGVITIPAGLIIWHRLGSAGTFLRNPQLVTAQLAYLTAGTLALVVALEFVFSPK